MTPLFQTAIPFISDTDLPDIARRLAGRGSRKMLGYLRQAAIEITSWPDYAHSVLTRDCNIVRGGVNDNAMFVVDALGYDALIITPIVMFVWRDVFRPQQIVALQAAL